MPASSAARQARSTARADRSGLRIVSPRKTKGKPMTDDLTDHYAPCRVLGHEWHHVGRADVSDQTSRTYGAIGYVSSCSHCGMRRVRWFTRSGLIAASPTYTPPEGYARHGDEVLSLQQWRSRWIDALDGTKRNGKAASA